MLDNIKFIAMIMAQEEINFEAELLKFTQEEQDAFVDFIIELTTNAMRTMKNLPQDQKIQFLIHSVAMIPQDSRNELAALINNIDEVN